MWESRSHKGDQPGTCLKIGRIMSSTSLMTLHRISSLSLQLFSNACFASRQESKSNVFLAIYIGAESGIIQWFLGIFYWGDEKNSLANLLWPGVFWGVQSSDLNRLTKNTYDISVLLWTLGYVFLWVLVARWLHLRKIYIKI